MDAFSYLSVVPSIVLGLAITQVLQGFRGVLLARARVKLFLPVLLWAVLLLLIYFQSWWSMYGLRSKQDWTFAAFAMVLLQTVTMYMLAALIFPDFGRDEVDLRASYFEHRGWFFGFAVANGVISIVKEVVLSGSLPEATNFAFHGVFIGAAIVAAITKNATFHRVNAFVAIAMFGIYVALLFTRLS
jgi:hypothetical protein